MRQFDVCQNPSERSREAAPYVVVLQSHLLSAMPTAIIAPLLRDDDRSAYTYTSVRVTFDEHTYILSAAELVAVDARNLRRTLGNLLEQSPA